MEETSEKDLSVEARELVNMINGLATQIMCDHYEDFTVGMRMRVSNVIKNTQQMLDDDPTRM